MAGALAGIRVLDLSRILAGPWASQLLADFGADIIKIERPGTGDDTRQWGPPWLRAADGSDTRESAYFQASNRNKRSVTADISTSGGQTIVRELALQSDIFLENFRVGSLQKYGLDAKTLRARNPALVYCSISAYGQESPLASDAGYDAMVQAAAGLMSITGEPDGPPLKTGVAVADLMAGMYASSAILAALHARAASGLGQHIDVPLFDTQVAWLANQAMNFLVGGEIPQRHGNAHPNIVPYQSFATADGYLMLAVGNDRQFAACARCLECAGLADEERFATNAARVAHREELIPLLAARLAEKPTSHWIKQFAQHGIPCGPINNLREVFASDHVKSRGLQTSLEHALAGKVPAVANPVRFSDTPAELRSAPPLLGQHTVDVLQGELGYSKKRIDELRSAGAI
ncbi:MAG: CoA transferase [Woeseia sp.]|nr:CoA transferase [Woeseia sp.]MBT8098018.1 CoA transferase [Woeseia sp.]NNE59342.1 CoA transferase [Woeseia sp.]NNL55632.1 CoA transferase [Woeseia sp.]